MVCYMGEFFILFTSFLEWIIAFHINVIKNICYNGSAYSMNEGVYSNDR